MGDDRTSGRSPAGTLAHGLGPGAVARLALLGLLWGTTFPMVRLGVAAHANPFLLLAAALAVAAAGMALLAWAFPDAAVSGRALLGSLGLGAILIGGNNLFLFWAVQFTTGGVASVVYATIPLLSVLVALPLGVGERPTAPMAAALGLGLLGVVVLGVVSTGTSLVTNGWAIAGLFGGAVAQSVGAVLVMRARPLGESRAGQAAQFTGAATAALVVTAAYGGAWRLPASAPVVGALLYFALFSAIAGYTVYFALIRKIGAVGANLVTYLNPLVALAVGVFLLGEAFASSELLGLALILGAVAVLEWGGRRRRAAANAGARPRGSAWRSVARGPRPPGRAGDGLGPDGFEPSTDRL
jgi:drug/metabolite transporter (DMT)-like permease